MDALPISDIKLQQLSEAQEQDEVSKQLRHHCYEGWPETKTYCQVPSVHTGVSGDK